MDHQVLKVIERAPTRGITRAIRSKGKDPDFAHSRLIYSRRRRLRTNAKRKFRIKVHHVKPHLEFLTCIIPSQLSPVVSFRWAVYFRSFLPRRNRMPNGRVAHREINNNDASH